MTNRWSGPVSPKSRNNRRRYPAGELTGKWLHSEMDPRIKNKTEPQQNPLRFAQQITTRSHICLMNQLRAEAKQTPKNSRMKRSIGFISPLFRLDWCFDWEKSQYQSLRCSSAISSSLFHHCTSHDWQRWVTKMFNFFIPSLVSAELVLRPVFSLAERVSGSSGHFFLHPWRPFIHLLPWIITCSMGPLLMSSPWSKACSSQIASRCHFLSLW